MTRFIKRGGWLLFPGLLGFGLFYIIPFVYSFYYAVTAGPMDKTFVFLNNFIQLINSRYFRIAFTNTIMFSAVSVPLAVIFSYFLALLQLDVHKKLRVLRISFVLPVLLPVASVAMIFNNALGQNSIIMEMIKHMAEWHTLPPFFSRLPLYLFFIWKNCGINMIILLTALLSIPKELYESSSLDGAGKRAQFYYISLPMTFPALLFVVIWTTVSSFKVFKEIYLWYGAYPDEPLYMLQHYINNHFNRMNYQLLSSGAILFFTVLYVIIFFFYKSERRYGKKIWG